MNNEIIDQEIGKGELLLHTGSAFEAEAVFRGLLQGLQDEAAGDGYWLLRAWDGLGASCLSLGRLDEADAWLRLAAKAAGAWLGEESVWMAHVLYHIAEVRVEQRRDEESIDLLNRVTSMCAKIGKDAEYLRVSVRLTRSNRYRALGQYDYAFREAWHAVEEAKSVERPGGIVGDACLVLGDLAFDRGDFAQAEDAYRSGLSYVEREGRTPAEFLLLVNLGACLDERGKREEAIGVTEEALTLAESPDSCIGDSLRAKALCNLGHMLIYIEGEEERSIRILERALELLNSRGAPDDCAEVLTALAEGKRRSGLIEESLGLSQRGISLLQESGHGASLRMADAKHEAASALLKKGSIREAERCALEQLEIRASAQGRAHLDYAKGLYLLGRILTAAGRYGEARGKFSEGMSIVEKMLGVNSVPYEVGRNELQQIRAKTREKAPVNDEE